MKNVKYETGIPFPEDLRPDKEFGDVSNVLKRARTACETAIALKQMGVDIQPTEEDKEAARSVFNEITSERPSRGKDVKDTGTALHLAALLGEYDKEIVQEKAQLRVYTVNKLIEETATEKASDRIRALELLGKAADLFTDKTEVTIKHESTEELERKLREKLSRVLEGEWVEEETVEVAPPQIDNLEIEPIK